MLHPIFTRVCISNDNYIIIHVTLLSSTVTLYYTFSPYCYKFGRYDLETVTFIKNSSHFETFKQHYVKQKKCITFLYPLDLIVGARTDLDLIHQTFLKTCHSIHTRRCHPSL